MKLRLRAVVEVPGKADAGTSRRGVPLGFARGRLFDSVAASFREPVTPLRMTTQ
jgi:hypothetical protein